MLTEKKRPGSTPRLTNLGGNCQPFFMSGELGNRRLSQTDRLTRRWWRKAFAVSGIVFVVGLIWISTRQVPREPVYRSKPLTHWLRTYAPSSHSGRHSREWNEADDAVRHLGTNCIPVLLQMVRAKDSQLRLGLVALAQKQPLIKIHFVPAAERNVEASRAFIVLGDRARDAMPALLRIYTENISVDSQAAIEDVFAWIGPAAKPAIPLLLQAATNANRKVRASALWALGEIHAEPQLCVPELIQALRDSDTWARLSAAHALGMFGTDAQPAIPSLTELTNMPVGSMSTVNTRWQVMLEARNALKKIDPVTVSPSSEIFPEFGDPTADSPPPPQ
jgi:HEAT repeat protein